MASHIAGPVTEDAFRVDLSEKCPTKRGHRAWLAEETTPFTDYRQQVAWFPHDRKKRDWRSVSSESNRRKRNSRFVATQKLVRAQQNETIEPVQAHGGNTLAVSSAATTSRKLCGAETTLEVSSLETERLDCMLGVVVSILVEHNYNTLADIGSLQRTCRSFFTTFNTPYVYLRVLRDCYNVPFRIPSRLGPAEALNRWLSHECEWLPLQDEGNIWLSRSVDPNPIGRHDRPVYVFGGQSVQESRYSSTLFKITLDGDQLNKKEIVPEGLGPCGRAACGVAFLESGGNGKPVSSKLYVFGGRTFGLYLDDVWSWEEETNKWELIPIRKDKPAPAKRWAHSMVSYPGGFLVYGGSAPGMLFDDLWSFRPELGWKKIECSGALPPSRAGQAAILHENSLYISGGNTAGPMVQTYQDFWRLSFEFSDGHPKPVGSWKEIDIKGPKLTARIGHSIIPLSSTRVLLFGGRNLSYGVKEQDQFAVSADIIDVDDYTNTQVEMPSWLQRTGACALNHPEGVVIWGGLSSDRVRCTTASVAPAVLLRPM